MKKLILSALLFGAVSLGVMAQDDVYFTPSKSVKKSMSSYEVINDSPAPLSGSNRDVDEYNRRGRSGGYFKKIGTDSLGNDIIEFHTSAEDITDTLAVYPGARVEYNVEDDYKYSRRLSRFDDYYWYDPWLYGHYGFGPYWRFRYSGFYLYDPFYDPWFYGSWYDPWYYGYYGGWYDPWYYGYYGWGYPYYRSYYYGTTWYVPGGIRTYASNRVTGTSNHGTVGRPGTTIAKGGNYGGYRGNGQTTRAYEANQNRNNRGTATSNGRFVNNRTYSNSTNPNNNRTYTPTTTTNSSISAGSRSSGGGFSGGGGGFSGGGTRSSGNTGGGGGRSGGRR